MYASGKSAWGISDRSGRRYLLREMKTEWNGSKVGPDEYEAKHPQLYPIKASPDPQALKDPRPDPDKNLVFAPVGNTVFPPLQNFAYPLQVSLGKIEVVIT